MEEVKRKILEKLKKLSEEERERREKIQDVKSEGGDSFDNQDYQFSLERLTRIKQERSNLEARLEEIEREEQEEEKKTLKQKFYEKNFSIPLVGKEFELLVNDNRRIKVKIVPLYEEIESNQDYFAITTDSPVAKIIDKMIERFVPKLERIKKVIENENDPNKIIQSIKSMNEWVAVSNYHEFEKRLKELAKDKNKLLRELDNFLKEEAELDISKIFEALRNKEFFVKTQGKEIKYKIINVN
ncbi:MAG: hypothetical protein RMJ51_01655 [Candidatus Calescibacterium sp.]|nr:hypothetical protein [Candidatus Calescibacterium sp.]MCX7971820.1 hypothetical protein [bacterium]MDW8194934.1 hypothetical protein [Candidatus Calescibacterium sp.]